MLCKLTHARHNAWHCTTPGLFRSLQKGSRKKQKLDVQHVIGDVRIHFTGYEPLGGNDLRLLQGLVAWAGLDGMVLSPCPDESQKISSELRKSLQTAESGSAEDAIFLQVSLTRLLHEIGVAASGKSIADAHQILKRLASVTVFFTQGAVTASSRLLGFVVDGETHKLWVALNSHLAKSIIGSGRNFTRINLDEVRLLKTDAGRIIHQRLCVWVNPGARRKVSVDVLCGYAWHEPAPTANSLCKRLERLHHAVADIQQCGWQAFRETTGDYVFVRPDGETRTISHKGRTIGHKTRTISHSGECKLLC